MLRISEFGSAAPLVPIRATNEESPGLTRLLLATMFLDTLTVPIFMLSVFLAGAFLPVYADKEFPSGLTLIGTNDKGYKEYRNEKDGSILIEIPAGSFTMGSDDWNEDEKPVHTVYLDTYYIGKFEVTVAQWRRFVKATRYQTEAEKGDGAHVYNDNYWEKIIDASWRKPYFPQTDQKPVVCISWNDARAYCAWAGLRLATEAEWEKAARGTDEREYSWGNSWCQNKGNLYEGDSYSYTSPVGSFPAGASPYGVMDMAGNVWEWCSDWYDAGYYSVSPDHNPQGPSSGDFRVYRSGSWGSDAKELRCAFRVWLAPSSRNCFLGFRVASYPSIK